MADEALTIHAPVPYDASEYEADPAAIRSPFINSDADFLVKPNAFGSGDETFLKGDRISKADLAKVGVTDPKRIKDLVENGTLLPLRAVDLTPTSEKKAK